MRIMRFPTFVSFVCFAAIAMAAVPANAELIFFQTGRSMSVKSHRIDGESLVLNLRSGGEIVCQKTAIVRIEPDEVPYPEPVDSTLTAPVVSGFNPTAGAYDAIIETVASEHHVDSRLVKAIVRVESAYQERARSRKGAMGLMQLMPDTARQYGVADPYDARSNIEAGIKHLKSLLERLPTRELAVAAYNAGEAAVQRYRGMPPYAETRAYVKNVLDLIR